MYLHNYTPQRTVVILVLLLSILVTACGSSPSNQAQASVFTVGIVKGTQSVASLADNFKTEMTQLGYVEGKNITYKEQGVLTNAADLEAEVKGLVDAKVNLIYAVGVAASNACKKVTAGTDLPVVFAPHPDPVKGSLVESMRNPSGNLTGVMTGLQYPAKTLEDLIKMTPDAKRVLVIYSPNGTAASFLPFMQDAAKQLGLELVLQTVNNNDDVSAAIAAIPTNINAILGLPDAFVDARIDDLVKAAIDHKLPLLSYDKSKVQAGALISYGWDYTAMAKQVAQLTDRILKGIKPSSLPIESVEYLLSVNLKTAQSIGITVPDDILRQATTIVR